MLALAASGILLHMNEPFLSQQVNDECKDYSGLAP